MEDCIYYKTEGEFFRILLNRPQSLNALNLDMLNSLDHAIEAAKKSNCRYVTIESLDSRAFAAGADVKFFSGLSKKSLSEYINLGKQVFNKLSKLDQISVAVVDGYCLGGGLELALAADLIISTERGRFGFPETTLGLIPGFSGIRRAIQRCGIHKTKKLILSASILEASEALTYGLVDYLIENADVESVKSLLIEKLGRSGPVACASFKKIISVFSDKDDIYMDALETATFVDLFDSDEASEGLEAFLQKRKSRFNLTSKS